MSSRFVIEKISKASSDYIFFLLLLLLLGLGLSTLFSSSYYYAGTFFSSPLFFLGRQVIRIGIGVVLAFFAYRIPLEKVRKISIFLLLFSFILLCATFIPEIGQVVMGARRWIIIGGFSFQPSELAKLAIIIYLAHNLGRKEERVDDFVNTILPPLIIVSILAALIYLQNDFSTAFFILLISFLLFFIARVKITYFIYLITASIPLALILLFTKEHRVRRLIAFIDPASDPSGAAYQVIASQNALINGGLWGAGLGRGVKKLGGLPEAHSDFIFAVLGEEAGFLGVLFIIALFIGFALRGYMISFTSNDKFSYYLGFGLTTSILYQALLNMAVVSGLIPATGIPLPFFSHGGSSIIITLIMCGLLLNISRNSGSTEVSE